MQLGSKTVLFFAITVYITRLNPQASFMMTTDIISPAKVKSNNTKKYSPYALPDYLMKHYWWAYLSPVGVNLFNHSFMVNCILWGQYSAIARDAVKVISRKSDQKVAGISCAYGEFWPTLIDQEQVQNLYLFDIAPIQLQQIQKNATPQLLAQKCHLFLGDAEHIALADQCVDTSVLFFLLHELPASVRTSVLAEAIRITEKGGRLVLADYAQFTQSHLFHSNKFFRTIFETLEPFLGEFWRCDLVAELQTQAKAQGRNIKLISEKHYFKQFYRLLEFSIE